MPERLMTIRVHMPQLKRDRNVRIYLPPDYFANLGRRYPVLYMHDGQNLFEPSKLSGFSWEVNQTLDRLFKLDPQRYAFIVVGIDSSTVGTRRLDEYCPWQCRIYETPENPWNYTLVDGEGDKYSEFILETLKPVIDSEFRTLPDTEHTMIAGSSLGGLISLYMGLKHNNVFSTVGAFSTALLFTCDRMVEFISRLDLQSKVKVWLYVGGNEITDPQRPEEALAFLSTNTKLCEVLQKKLGRENVTFVVDKDATHSEEYWRIYFEKFIKWVARSS